MTKGLKIAAIAVVVGVVTYVGLEALLPHHKAEVKLSGLVPADSVFGGKLESPDQVAAAAAATPGAEAVDAGATTPSGPAVAGDDAMAPSADESSDQSPSSDTAATADEAAATTVAADDAGAEPPAEAQAAAPPPAPAAAAPAKPVAAAKPAAKPEAKPSKPASKPVSKPADKKAPAAVASKSAPWWTSAGNATGLQVIYVGSAAFERAIVVMGNAPFANVSSAAQNIHISDASGKAVAGSWKLGSNNKAMLVFPVSKSGKFQVSVGAGLSDAKNRKLGQSVKGPIVVQ